LTPLLYRLGHFCARHPVSVLVVWLAVALAIVCVARTVGQETNDNLSLPGTDSQAASNLLGDKFPDQASGLVPIAFRGPSGARLSDTKYKKPIERVTKAYSKDPAITQAVGPFGEEGGDQLNKKHTIGYISLNLKDSPSELSIEEAQRIISLDRPLEKAGLDPAAGGYLGQKVSKPSTHVSEVVGLTAAVFILLFTFGTAIAMGIPILTAILGLSAGLGIIALISHTVEVPTSAPTLATMIGLGVGIDYALFIVTRHRSQLAEGMQPRESVARATATAGGAVVFAGGTVIIALLSLAAAGIPLVTTLGYTAAIVVVVAASAATTLLPAILGLIGLSINRLRVPGMRQHHDQRPHGWVRWAAYVGSHPWPALIVGLVVLLIFAAPVRSLHLGQTDNGALPKDTQSRQSYDKMSEGFGPGSNGPMLIAVNLSKPAHNDQADLDKLRNQQQAKQKEAQEDKAIEKQVQEEAAKKEQSSGQEDKEMFLESKSSDPRLTALRTDLQKTKGVDTVTLPLVNKKGDAAVYTVTATTAPSSRATEDLVNILRNDVIPKATKGKQMSADVGGTTASYIDLASEISSKLPLVIGIVLVLSFFLLLLAFRSLLVPLKAVVMNVFSILAAFGVVTYAFNHDWTARLIGLEGAIPIVSFVPLMMFAILFGLSMDYEVFLMTHVREQWKETNDPHEAVVHGLASTARVITSAAMIMVSVFLAFVINGDPTVKQFGLGMAVAVAVDATVVRCVLVPAIMSLLGSSGWWLPKWMERASPKFSIEGNEWFAKHEIPAEQANTLPEKPEEHHEPDRTE
jgi:putative drug exporter of the RND superfamily